MPRISLTATNRKSIQRVIEKVTKYKETLAYKCEKTVYELADIGVQVADMNSVGYFGSHVFFYKKMDNPTLTGCTGLLLGVNTGSVRGEGIGQPEVDPILMEEFGSGLRALPPQGLMDGHILVGQGTFPSPTAQYNATNPNGWWYCDLAGVWHHSTGYQPNRPMHKAMEEMLQQTVAIVRSNFYES